MERIKKSVSVFLSSLLIIFILFYPHQAFATLTTAHVLCDTTSGGDLLLGASNSYLGWQLTNTSGTITVYLGPSGVTASTGGALLPTASMGDSGSKMTGRENAVGDAIYCITSSSSATVTVMMWQ